MNRSNSPALPARIISLHLHPTVAGAPLRSVASIEVVVGKGVLENPRYFGRNSQTPGQPSRRQVSLIGREQIAEHSVALGLKSIPPGAVRANIETQGADLIAWLGQKVRIGEAVLLFYEPRTPCAKMDEICTGLRTLMTDNRQGVMAEVLESGKICIGDILRPVE